MNFLRADLTEVICPYFCSFMSVTLRLRHATLRSPHLPNGHANTHLSNLQRELSVLNDNLMVGAYRGHQILPLIFVVRVIRSSRMVEH